MAEIEQDRPAPVVPGKGHDHHGNSPAAWTLVGVMTLGFLVAGIGLITLVIWVIVLGAVIGVVGLVLGRVLSAAGYGVNGRSHD